MGLLPVQDATSAESYSTGKESQQVEHRHPAQNPCFTQIFQCIIADNTCNLLEEYYSAPYLSISSIFLKQGVQHRHTDRNTSYLPKSANQCPTTSINAVPTHTLRESQNKAMTQLHTSCFSVMQYFLELRNPCAVKSFKSALNISRYVTINTYCALGLKTSNIPATLLSSFNTNFRCSSTCSLK